VEGHPHLACQVVRQVIEEGELTLTDGVKLEYASMTKSLNGSS
jgi:hypothetical protein